MHTSARSQLALALVLLLLLVACEPVRAFDDELHELSVDGSVRTADGLLIELPSRQQRDALVTESPTLLLARSRRSEQLFALDGVAHVDGRGRMGQSGKISITRGLPLTADMTAQTYNTNANDDDDDDLFAINDAAIAFGPEELAMGTRVTCEPALWYVDIINRGRAAVRLDAIEFTRSGYELLTTVDGAVLAPSTHATIAVVLTLSDPEPQYEAFMRVLTSAGPFALRITAHVTLHPLGVRGIRAIVPAATAFTTTLALRNPTDALLRVVDVFSHDAYGSFALPNGATAMTPRALAQPGGPRIGVWDIPPRATRAVVDYTFTSETRGVCLTYVRMRLSTGQELAVPVTIEVVRPGVYFEPSRVALGALTAHDAVREMLVDLFNAADEPIEVVGVDVRARTMDVTVALNGPTVLPPKTRVQQALRIHAQSLRSGDDSSEGDSVGDDDSRLVAVLALRTNVSASSGLVMGDLQLSGVQLHGSIAYAFNETLVGVTTSLRDALSDGPDGDVSSNTFKTPQTFANGSIKAVEAGTTVERTLHLRNLYNVPLELERVWVADDETVAVVTVEAFEPGVAASGAYWNAPVVLRVTPLRRPDAFATSRVLFVYVETHLVTLQVPIYVFYGTLQLGSSVSSSPSTTVLSELAQPGYLPATKLRGTKLSKVCLPVDDAASGQSVKRATTAQSASVKLCRSVVLDVGKVSRHGVRDAVLHLSNVNPIALDVKVASVLRSELYDLTVRSELSEAPQAPVEVAAIGRQWADAAQSAAMLDSVVSLQDATSKTKANANKRLHDSIAVPPGYDYALTLGLHARDVFGSFTKYVLTLETPTEFVHVYVRFESVDGHVQPVMPEFAAQPTFPGRVALVYFQYASTFTHDVAVRAFTFPASAVQIVSTSSASFDGTTLDSNGEGITYMTVSVLLSPSYSDACAQSAYLADCDLPRLAAHARTHPLSHFGDEVSTHDLVQFERRQSAWQAIERASDPKTRPQLNVSIVLKTAMMDVAPVRIVVPLTRASVTTANLSETFAEVAFGRTKVFERQERRVRVHNPSSVSIDMELAVSFHEHAMFHRCNASVTRDTSACLAEWEAAVLRSAGNSSASQSVAPFFVVQRVVRVPIGEDAELGPIYFFPSQELEIETMVFVRSELTHIEPVMLSATSGRGALDVRVLAEAAAYGNEAIKAVDDIVDIESEDADVQDDSTSAVMRFVMSASDASSFEAQERVVELANVGTYDLVVERTPDSTAQDPTTQMVLAPGESLDLQVVYEPNCFVSRIHQSLEIVTDASATPVRVALVALVRPTTSFACLRARLPPALVSFALAQWRFAVAVALLVALYSVFVSLENVWTLHQRQRSLRAPMAVTALATSDSVETNRNALEADRATVALPSSEDACDASSSAMSRLLDELETSAFVPATRVETPAVTRLLLERQRRSALLAKSEPTRVATSRSDITETTPAATTSTAVAATLAAPVHSQVPEQLPTTTKANNSDTPAAAPAPAPAPVPPTTSTANTADAARSRQAIAVVRTATPPPAAVAAATAPTAKASKQTAPLRAKTKDESVSARVVTPAAAAVTPPPKDSTRPSGASTVVPRGRKGAKDPSPTTTAAPAQSSSPPPPPPQDPAPTKTPRGPSTGASSYSSLLPPKPATPKTKRDRTVSSDKPVVSATETPARRTSKAKQLYVATAPSKVPSPHAKPSLETTMATATSKRSVVTASSVSSPVAVQTATAKAVRRVDASGSGAALETPVPVTANRATRPSSSSGSRSKRTPPVPHHERADGRTKGGVILAERVRAPTDSSSSSVLSPLSIEALESVDVLASSIDSTSTSTTVSFDSDDAKLSPPSKARAAETDDFFLSMTFEAPFSSFGAIGKKRRPVDLTDQPQSPLARTGDSSEDTDAVLVERFGSLPSRGTAPTARPRDASGIHGAEDDDDDWSDLYFDSIRSEIGRLVASSESSSSQSHAKRTPRGFASLHPTSPPRVLSLDTPVAAAAAMTAPPGFSPADANPLASLAAFERLRSASAASAADGDGAGVASLHVPSESSSRFAFASRLSLFGPSLAQPSPSPTQAFRVALDSPGEGRSRIAASSPTATATTSANVAVAAPRDWAVAATPQDASARTALASLGGVELVPAIATAPSLSTPSSSSA